VATNATNCTLAHLPPGRRLLLQVMAHNELGASPAVTLSLATNAVDATPPQPPLPPQPTLRGADALGWDWSNCTFQDGGAQVLRAQLQFREAGQAWSTVAEGWQPDAALVTGLWARRTYCARLRAANDLGWSDWSPEACVNTSSPVPPGKAAIASRPLLANGTDIKVGQARAAASKGQQPPAI
jgi:hypothetical protein